MKKKHMPSARYEALKKSCVSFLDEIYADAHKVVVFGEGNLCADIMLVGEAPGEQETLQRHPFVGKAGKNLDEFLAIMQLPREAIYITNVVKFRPTKSHPQTGRLSNRPPDKEEILLCKRFLLEEIELVQPRVVVTLGNVALRTLSGQDKATIGAMHGVPVTIDNGTARLTIFPLYHPASIIYNRALKETYERDVHALQEYMLTR